MSPVLLSIGQGRSSENSTKLLFLIFFFILLFTVAPTRGPNEVVGAQNVELLSEESLVYEIESTDSDDVGLDLCDLWEL